MILDDIITALSDRLKALACFQKAKMCGIAETVTNGDRSNPVWNQNGNGFTIVPDANQGTQVYFRVLGRESEEQEEPFGRFGWDITFRIGVFVIGHRNHFSTACGMTTQEAVTSLVMNTISGAIASTDARDLSVDRLVPTGNKVEVLAQEFPGYDLQNHVLDVIAVGIEATITGTACETIC